jgi:hypothetical protein
MKHRIYHLTNTTWGIIGSVEERLKRRTQVQREQKTDFLGLFLEPLRNPSNWESRTDEPKGKRKGKKDRRKKKTMYMYVYQ